MNANQATTIIFIMGIIVSILNVLLPIVPPQDVIYVTLALGLISEVVNFLKSGYEDKPPVEGA